MKSPATRFVIFRYPNESPQIFLEDKNASEEFWFSEFESEEIYCLKGFTHSFKSSLIPAYSLSELSIKSTSKDSYSDSFLKYKTEISSGRISKAILSRIVQYPLLKPDVESIFQRLNEAYPSAFVYLASLGEKGIWGGASPEKLIEYHEPIATTVALAGTKKTNELSAWTAKEIDEHRKVEEYIENVCETNNAFELVNKSEVYIVEAGPVFHLKSDFEIRVEPSQMSHFIHALHPTSAVCGLPRKESKSFILSTETHQRELYTGFLGLKSKDNHIRFYVNLRCFQLAKDAAFIYIGGGITEGSVLENEWDETEIKASTIEKILTIEENTAIS